MAAACLSIWMCIASTLTEGLRLSFAFINARVLLLIPDTETVGIVSVTCMCVLLLARLVVCVVCVCCVSCIRDNNDWPRAARRGGGFGKARSVSRKRSYVFGIGEGTPVVEFV